MAIRTFITLQYELHLLLTCNKFIDYLPIKKTK